MDVQKKPGLERVMGGLILFGLSVVPRILLAAAVFTIASFPTNNEDIWGKLFMGCVGAIVFGATWLYYSGSSPKPFYTWYCICAYASPIFMMLASKIAKVWGYPHAADELYLARYAPWLIAFVLLVIGNALFNRWRESRT